ncbi:hypothetical protein FRC05_003502 [Tulasnella sp. 425]|nr:hypothetical protein FRC05_003502 [Tulasnella sp. 425]
MPPPNVHALMNTMEGDGEASFSKAHNAELLCDPDAPFHVMLENINASSAFPSQSSSPVDAPQFQAPSDLGDYAQSIVTATSMDTMITWRAAESVAGLAGGQVTAQAPDGQDDRPDTPVASQVAADHRQSRGFERSRHERLPSQASSARPRSILDDWEPEPYDGTAGKRCCEFIHSIRKYAWKHGRNNDLKWIAEYAETRLTDDALVWHSRQPPHVRDDWRQLVSELLRAFYPGYSNDTENPLFTPGSSPSSRTTFSPSTSTSPSSSDGLRSPPSLTSSFPTLLTPPLGSQQTVSQSSNRLVSMSSHVSLASSSSQQIQRGQLLIMDNNDEKYFVKIKLNGRGGCMPTTDRSKSLLVKNATGRSRQLYLDNCSSDHATLGISWCIERGYTPHLSKGSLDCADLVYLRHNGTSSSRTALGPSRDMVWTVKDDNSVQAFWRDSEQIEHELHAVMKPEVSFLKSLVSPPRIVLVKDPDAFIPRNPGYIRSRLFFDP